MILNFATCERHRALEFLQTVYPSRVITDSPESAGPLLDFVQQDVVRVQDPMMHSLNGTIQIVPGTNWDESLREKVTLVAAKFAAGEA